MIKYKHIALLSLAFLALAMLMGFAKRQHAKSLYNNFYIDILDGYDKPFITEAEVISEIEKLYTTLDSVAIGEININLLEETLDNHPSILKAEVYSDLNGSLRITVSQHQPLARVIDHKPEYYLLANGGKMPLSTNFSATVPLLTGVTNDSMLAKLSSFWEEIQDDTFFKSFFSGMHIAPNGDLILYPKIGKHKVILGTVVNYAPRLKKLKTFYLKAMSTEELKDIKELNLKFKDQVICRKT